jgi:hypothetical protein
MPDRQRTPWDDHEREQLRAWSNLTYRQRLDWLWQAKLFAQRAQKAAAARHAAQKKSPPSSD